MNPEACRSMTFDKTPLKTEDDESAAYLEKGLLSSKEKMESLMESNGKPNRRGEFPLDQRGSVNTDVRQTRLRNRLLTHRGSVAVRSTVSQGRSEFSFHPSINYTTKWKPKYDDHHDHKRMWNRMHDENRKIHSKRRLASEQKKIEEMASCTFTPRLVTQKGKFGKKDPLDVKHLSLRLYQYADIFKEKREKMKDHINTERGEEIRFTPKLETVKTNKMLETVNENSNVYDNLYEDYKHREDNKKRLRDTLYSNGSLKKLDKIDDIEITFQKPNANRTKHRRFRQNRLNGSNKKIGVKKVGGHFGHVANSARSHQKSFSSTLYSEGRLNQAESQS